MMDAPLPLIAHLGERTFSLDDQRWFADASGDVNPIHVDPITARRLLTGRPLVHGVHVVISAIDMWPSSGAHPRSLACTFSHPISVGDRVEFSVAALDADRVVIEAAVRGRCCAQVTLGMSEPPARAARGPADETGREVLAEVTEPWDHDPAGLAGRRYAIAVRSGQLDTRFPRAGACLGSRPLAALARLSYVVGMLCPGRHSLFASLNLDLADGSPTTDVLAVDIERHHAGFGLCELSFAGCVSGRLKAFQRPRPQAQPSMASLGNVVAREEFAGTRSLILGGSRGLGELTAKILAAGGGDVVVTYATGRADAERVRDEIAECGRGACQAVQLALADQPVSLPGGHLDAVYFFATPMIARTRATTFDHEFFRELCEVYVARFYDVCAAIESTVRDRRITVFVPSTVYVTERPSGMLEYSMAKAAAEHLIDEINRSFTHVRVVSVRLPRLSTDQTASIVRQSLPAAADVLLPIIRSIHAERARP